VPVKATIKGQARTYSACTAHLGSLRVKHSARMAACAMLGGIVVQTRRKTWPKTGRRPDPTFTLQMLS
jgi:hypothetical protein